MKRLLSRLGSILERDPRKDPNALVFLLLTIGAIAFPIGVQVVTRGSGSFLISQAADAGVYVLLAIGLAPERPSWLCLAAGARGTDRGNGAEPAGNVTLPSATPASRAQLPGPTTEELNGRKGVSGE